MREALGSTIVQPERIPAPAPGVYPGTSGDDYRRWDAVSFRRLMRLDTSPYTMRHFLLHPEDEPETSDAAAFGILAHAALLEPERYVREYARLPEGRSNSKAVTEAETRILAMGKTPIKPVHSIAIDRMLASMRAHPQVSKVLDAPDRIGEISAVGIHTPTGLAMKVRTDLILPSRRITFDLKTSGRPLAQDEIERGAVWDWALQLSMMQKVYDSAAPNSDFDSAHYGVLAVEQKPAFECGLFFPDEGTMELASHRIDVLMALYAKCEKAQHWPRIGEEGVVGVGARPWVFQQYGQEV